MERVGRGDNFVSTVELRLAPFTRQLTGTLVRLGSRVTEEDPIKCRIVHQQLRQFELWQGIEQVGRLGYQRRLFADRLRHGGIGVSDVQAAPAGHKVQVHLTVVVPNTRTLRLDDHQRYPLDHLHIVAAFLLYVLLGFRSLRNGLFLLQQVVLPGDAQFIIF